MAKRPIGKDGKKEKRAPRAAATEGGGSGLSKRQKIDAIIAKANKDIGPRLVQRAADTFTSYLLRRPTGILSIDLALNGGFPAAAPSVIVGPDGSGKDYLLWCMLAEQQRIYGEDFCCGIFLTEFKPDKVWMKACGFHIALSEDEITDLNMARIAMGQEELTNDELEYYRYQVGEIILIYGVSADKGFDVMFELMEANICQTLIVNSIGYLQTEAKEDTDSFSDFAQRSSEASLLTKVLPKFSMYLNRDAIAGKPNETSLILIDQVRAKQDAQARGRPLAEKEKYRAAAGSWALKHGKAIEFFIHNGPKIIIDDVAMGRKKTWEVTKGKLGVHEGLKGEFNFFYGEGADVWSDLLPIAVRLGVLQKSGSWYSYEDEAAHRFKVNSEAAAIAHLRNNEETFTHLKTRCLQSAGITYRHK